MLKSQSQGIQSIPDLVGVGSAGPSADNPLKKMITFEVYEQNQPAEIGHCFHMRHDAILQADCLLKIIGWIFQVNEFFLLERDVQFVNAGKLVTSLFFQIDGR